MASKKYQLTDLATGRSSELAASCPGPSGPDVLDISALPRTRASSPTTRASWRRPRPASAITYIDGDAGVLLYRGYPIEQLAEHSTLHRGGVPAAERRAAERRSSSTSSRTRSRAHTMINESLLRLLQRLSPQRPPDGDGVGDRGLDGRPSTTTRRTSTIRATARSSRTASSPSCRRSPPRPTSTRSASRSSIRATTSTTARTCCTCSSRCPARPTTSIRCRRRRSTCCSSCTPTTSRTAAPRPCGSPAARAPTRTRPSRPASRRSGARRTAAPTRPCSTCSRRSATPSNVAEVPREGQGQERAAPAHGLRPPRLQELRPARRDHPRDVPPGAREARPANDPLFELALRLEEIALKDEYFISRKLYPNVDFYSGIIYRALGIPTIDVHRDVRDRAHRGLGRALAGDDLGPGDADRAAAPALHRPRRGATTSRSSKR